MNEYRNFKGSLGLEEDAEFSMNFMNNLLILQTSHNIYTQSISY